MTDKKQSKNMGPEIDPKTKKPVKLAAPGDEKGGFKDAGLLEPTRHGDWEVKGRCSDF